MSWTLESQTASDGYRWQYRHYAPRGAARADVVCVHGIQSHSGWYEGSCERLAAAGFDVCFLDRRGSGVNLEARGDAPGFRRLLDDIAEFLVERRSGRPTILVAISWGGKLAAALERRRPGLVAAFVLLCPGFCARIGLPLRQRLAVATSRIVSPRQAFDVPLTEAELFTANPEAIRFIREDPLALRQATARLLVESARLDGYLRWFPPRLSAPALLLLAEHDRIIDNTRTRAFVGRISSSDLKVIEYPGAHHTLEFEPGIPFVSDVLSWLAAQFDNGRGAT
jgi:alpha-beta hydrolase superfamily lysophospholipase